jgi:hypothetical protein
LSGQNSLKNLCVLKDDGPLNILSDSFFEGFIEKRFFSCIALFGHETFVDRKKKKGRSMELDYINIALSMGSLCIFVRDKK